MSVYALKPKFQALLRPLVASLAALGVTANVVTLIAAVVSVLLGTLCVWYADRRLVFLAIPVWMFLRMALNAVDGMLAREFHQQSVLGGYLNELGDIISDAALYAPFAVVPPFTSAAMAGVIGLAMLSECAGMLGPAAGASRRYDGPMGKSDRAVVFGALGLWVAVASPLPGWIWWLVPVLLALLALTTVNRVRGGVAEARQRRPR